MKKITKTILVALVIIMSGFSNVANAQSLFKDLNPGNTSSGPENFITINGMMYFVAKGTGIYNHNIWKSDGTEANTTIVKADIINTNVGGVITLLNLNGTLYFAVNLDGSSSSATKTVLWKSDGTPGGTVVIDTLKNGNPLSNKGFPPRNWTVVGNNVFFQMNTSTYSPKLWVSDGTKSGTIELGNFAESKPMTAYNGKLYYSGSTNGFTNQLYTSDGTVAGTTLANSVGNPESWISYNNTLYFNSKTGMWKTDGTTTTSVYAGEFSNATIFKNTIYFKSGIGLWKSDGTTLGTVFVTDSANQIMGANADYLITGYMKSMPPYDFIYKRTDGTTVVSASKDLGSSASFVVLNNKMYHGISDGRGVWVTDGTEAGTSQIATNISNYLYVYKGNIFYNAFESATGYELWTINGGGSQSTINNISNNPSISIYPNPSVGVFNFLSQVAISEITIYNVLGEVVYSEKVNSNRIKMDLKNQPTGIYFYKITDENGVSKSGKIILE